MYLEQRKVHLLGHGVGREEGSEAEMEMFVNADDEAVQKRLQT